MKVRTGEDDTMGHMEQKLMEGDERRREKHINIIELMTKRHVAEKGEESRY